MEKKKTNAQSRALEHFDDFYQSVFGKKWPGIRAALLTEHKYAAIVNNYGDVEATKKTIEFNGAVNLRDVYETFRSDTPYEREESENGKTDIDKRMTAHLASTESEEIHSIYQKGADAEIEKIKLEQTLEPSRTIQAEHVVDYKKSLHDRLTEDTEYDFDRMISSEIGIMGLQEFIPATKLKGMEGFVLESDHYRYYNTNVDFPLKFEADNFEYPKALDIYIYPQFDISRFSRPKTTSTRTFSHFLLDGASILPALMLNVNANDVVLDACAAPGGKSLVLLQTLMPERIVCNDLSKSRCYRIQEFFKQYLPDFKENWLNEKVSIENSNILHRTDFSCYDKVRIFPP